MKEKLKIRDIGGGADPNKVFIDKFPREDDWSRFQSMKKFRDDCKTFGGKPSRVIVEGYQVKASCKMPNVSDVTIEEHMSKEEPPEKYWFASIRSKTKEPMVVLGTWSSASLLLTKRGSDPIEIWEDNRPIGMSWSMEDVKPKKLKPAYAGLNVRFPKPTTCTIRVMGESGSGVLHPYVFHGSRAKYFNPNRATIRDVTTECKI